MRILLFFLATSLSLHLSGQREILNQCVVLELSASGKADIRAATFDLPFYAARKIEGAPPTKVLHYMFDVAAPDAKANLKSGLLVTGLRTYEYGEVLKDNEIAFFIMEWPEEFRLEFEHAVLASFPTVNGHTVSTDHLIIKEQLKLPDALVQQLELSDAYIEPGAYALVKKEVEY